MNYISLFSGIEAATVAWHPLGFEPVAFSEIDKFPCEVLAKRFPDVPNLGDITQIDWSKYRGEIDIVVGGSPCQSFSIAAGKNRTGLQGESGLMYEYIRAIQEIMPRYFVWENVPGALSVERGKAFGQLLYEMAVIGGYGCSWRILDAQFFGVPQRRRRVFLIGCLGDIGGGKAYEILFNGESVSWDYQSNSKKRETLAAAASESIAKRCGSAFALQGNMIGRSDSAGPQGCGVNEDVSFTLNCADRHAVAYRQEIISATGGEYVGALCARDYKGVGNQYVNEGKVIAQPVYCAADHTANAAIDEDLCGTLRASGGMPPYITTPKMLQVRCGCAGGGKGALIADNMSATLSTAQTQTLFQPDEAESFIVRKLTPRECERLQGFPDDWTLIPYRSKPADECPDGPRYKALGNSMAVPVMRWIGEQIKRVDESWK